MASRAVETVRPARGARREVIRWSARHPWLARAGRLPPGRPP